VEVEHTKTGQKQYIHSLITWFPYVNDIPLSMDSPILLFADDTKIFQSLRSEADYLQLQQDIDLLYEWSNTWLLSFNISKRYTLHPLL